MAHGRRFRRRSPLLRGSTAFSDRPLDADTIRDTIGAVVYDRVMQWDDTGAAKALQEAEQRKRAREIRKPCWVPKLNDDLYIGTVDWNSRDFEEVCSMPKSAVAFTDESCGGICSMPPPSLTRESKQQEHSLPVLDLHELSSSNYGQQVLEASNDYPLMVDAVLEHCADGLRLLVGGWPVEPSGWESKQQEHSLPVLDLHELSSRNYGQQVLEASSDYPLMVDAVLEHCADGLRLLVGGWPVEPSGWDEENSQFADGPWIVEAVLEDFGDGQRLLVGGWPVQPSWDELDTNWSQLGWEGYTAKPKRWEYMQVQSSWNCHNSVCLSQQESGWQSSWCHGNVSYSLHQGQNFMMAF